MHPDNVANRQRVQRVIANDGRCTHCPPHRGENHGATGKPDVRYADGKITRNKSKDVK